MIKQADEEQGLLDIEILAVQIEEDRKQKLYAQAKHFRQALERTKAQQYREFKE